MYVGIAYEVPGSTSIKETVTSALAPFVKRGQVEVGLFPVSKAPNLAAEIAPYGIMVIPKMQGNALWIVKMRNAGFKGIIILSTLERLRRPRLVGKNLIEADVDQIPRLVIMLVVEMFRKKAKIARTGKPKQAAEATGAVKKGEELRAVVEKLKSSGAYRFDEYGRLVGYGEVVFSEDMWEGDFLYQLREMSRKSRLNVAAFDGKNILLGRGVVESWDEKTKELVVAEVTPPSLLMEVKDAPYKYLIYLWGEDSEERWYLPAAVKRVEASAIILLLPYRSLRTFSFSNIVVPSPADPIVTDLGGEDLELVGIGPKKSIFLTRKMAPLGTEFVANIALPGAPFPVKLKAKVVSGEQSGPAYKWFAEHELEGQEAHNIVVKYVVARQLAIARKLKLLKEGA